MSCILLRTARKADLHTDDSFYYLIGSPVGKIGGGVRELNLNAPGVYVLPKIVCLCEEGGRAMHEARAFCSIALHVQRGMLLL